MPQVPGQILKNLRSAILNGDREIQIRLDPPELGSLRMHLQVDGESLRVVIETSSGLSRQALDEALPDLRRMLTDEGLEVEDLIVQDWNEEAPSDGQEQDDADRQDNGEIEEEISNRRVSHR